MFQGVLRLPPNAISSSGARQNLRWGATTGWCEYGEKKVRGKMGESAKKYGLIDWWTVFICKLFQWYVGAFLGLVAKVWFGVSFKGTALSPNLLKVNLGIFFSASKFWVAFVLPKISCEVSEIHLCPDFRSWWEHDFFLLRCPVLWKRLIGCVPESMKASLSHVSQLHRTPSNGNL